MEETVKRNEGLAKQYQELLSPEGNLVAVKMVTSSEIEGLQGVKRPEIPVTVCQMISQARYIGRMRLLGPDEQVCYAANSHFGFKEMPREAYKRYVGWTFKTDEAARKGFETHRTLPLGRYCAMIVSPLGRCPVAPDVVVFMGNASQMLVILAAYLNEKGGSLPLQWSGLGACASVVVGAMLDEKPRIDLPGNAWKNLGIPSNTDLICGIPGNMLEALAENMRFLRDRGGARYPPAWQYIQWAPQGYIGDLLKPDGRPTWLRSK